MHAVHTPGYTPGMSRSESWPYLFVLISTLALGACADRRGPANSNIGGSAHPVRAETGGHVVHQETDSEGERLKPPPAMRAWMDRLTVAHRWDPVTGFLVAEEVIALPDVLSRGPDLAEAVDAATRLGLPLIVFATADRCAPCQQYRKDALHDARVVAVLSSGRVIAAHVEVDRQGELADRYLGSRGIPMTWRLDAGTVTGEFRGQRSADALLQWLNEQVP